ncbi:MAG: outer membrane biosynthesis protein TonB [Bradymonadia bacterium]
MAPRDEPLGARVLVLLLALLATLLTYAFVIGGLGALQLLEPEEELEDESLVFVTIEEPKPAVLPELEPVPEVLPEPTPEPEPEIELEPEPEIELEPEPEINLELEPEPEIIREPEPRPEVQPEPEREEPVDPETERRVITNLEGQSFAEGEGGPSFNVGDTARGGRPDRRSVDPNDDRSAVDAPERPAERVEPDPEPRAEPQRRGRQRRDRDPSWRPGLSLAGAAYPEGAQLAGAEATCRYTLLVGEDGSINDIVSIVCSGAEFDFEGALRQHLTRVLPNRPFRPAIRDNREVAQRIGGRHTFRQN